MPLMRFVFTVFFLFYLETIFATECQDWFSSLKIKDKKNCESVCATSQTDMATYSCTIECENLCKKLNNKSKDKEKNELNFYGLTDEEVKFCSSNKMICLKAYKLSWEAESLCEKIYPQSRVNDESDACRHYLWAILMAKETTIGLSNAESILKAHEANPFEALDEKEMDLANNRRGLLDYLENKKLKLNDEEILNLFKKNLQKKQLNILKPKYTNSGGLP